MNKSDALILWFDQLNAGDVPLVGGKNASLGEMYVQLRSRGVAVPNGFALTATGYRLLMKEAGLTKKLMDILKDVDTGNPKNLAERGKKCRAAILEAELPKTIKDALTEAYGHLCLQYGPNTDVAVRSSATAEDLPDASFAGQQESYLNIRGPQAIHEATKKCIASLFTDRAISYRVDKKFSHFDVALSVGIQKMVRSDKAASGVMFTLDTDTGFPNVVYITSIYGLGELIVQGMVNPDEFYAFKPGLREGKRSIISKKLGSKKRRLIYSEKGGKPTKEIAVSAKERARFSISDDEVLTLAHWAMAIEDHYSFRAGRWQPMDIEWAKDGENGQLFIVQARPETVHASNDTHTIHTYHLDKQGEVIVRGAAVGNKIATGKARVIKDANKMSEFKEGEILVTEITDPDWEPIMKKAAAIITDKGGRTSHAAIVSRELGIACVVGTNKATKAIKTGEELTVDCSSAEQGRVMRGILPFKKRDTKLDTLPETRTSLMVNVGTPDEAFRLWNLPVKGVGLAREEFIIASHIGVHPMALLNYDKLKNAALKKKIDKLTEGYHDRVSYYVERLAQGIAKIAAPFHPHPVIVRFSDFKTNEYRTLLGGELFEPHEENPMIGWRGASRYYDDNFRAAFALECKAIKRARDEYGLRNIVPMVPFCRTPEEGRKVLAVMAEEGLRRGENELKVYMMCEIPANVILADKFLELFDGFSIGSNDLTQLTLGMDRDSDIIAHIANENDASVKDLIRIVIHKSREQGKYVGICGQAPGDYPEFMAFLVREGIASISLNPDTVLSGLMKIAQTEKEV